MVISGENCETEKGLIIMMQKMREQLSQTVNALWIKFKTKRSRSNDVYPLSSSLESVQFGALHTDFRFLWTLSTWRPNDVIQCWDCIPFWWPGNIRFSSCPRASLVSVTHFYQYPPDCNAHGLGKSSRIKTIQKKKKIKQRQYNH